MVKVLFFVVTVFVLLTSIQVRLKVQAVLGHCQGITINLEDLDVISESSVHTVLLVFGVFPMYKPQCMDTRCAQNQSHPFVTTLPSQYLTVPPKPARIIGSTDMLVSEYIALQSLNID